MVHKWTGFKELQQHIIKDNQYIDGADVYDLLQGENQLHGTRSCGFRQLVVAALLVPLLVEIMVEMVKSRNKTNQKGGQKVPKHVFFKPRYGESGASSVHMTKHLYEITFT